MQRFALAGIALALVGASGCATRASCLSGDLEPLARAPSFVVVRSDYVGSTALALLDADGNVLADDWIDSGSRPPHLVTALGPDVAVPSTPLGGITWIDRYGVDVLSFARPSGLVAAQIDLRGATLVHDGFSPNPLDAVRLPGGRILVTRSNPNLNPTPAELAHGNDIVVIEDGVIVETIELHADQGAFLARPDRLLPLEAGETRRILVTLGRLDATFGNAPPHVAGTAAVLTIDQDLVPSPPLELGELQNCVSASLDPNDASRAYVLCTGLTVWTDEERLPHAGIVELTLDATGALSITGMTTLDGAVPTNGLVALGGRRVIAVATGHVSPDAPDRLFIADLASGASREIYRTTSQAFVLGDGAFDAAHGIALVPDAETRTIHRIDAASEELVGEIEFDSCVGLPPREIGPL